MPNENSPHGGRAYITALGAFLPGAPVPNDRVEAHLGRIHGRPSRLRERVLAQNGIRTRHYAIDEQQRSLHSNAEMAALAVRDALSRRGAALESIDLIAAATTQGDVLVPGFASMVHGELGSPPCEVASLHGVCASGMTALKHAMLQVAADGKHLAIACASEFPSRLFKASRYETQSKVLENGRLDYETEFLRWMLSDGAGAAVLEPVPSPAGTSFRIEWIEAVSHAGRESVCMLAGATRDADGALESWLDHPRTEDAAELGAFDLRQDVRRLDDLVRLGVDAFFDLMERGRIRGDEIDWLVCHYSSHVFRGRIEELLRAGGFSLPDERWFTNLHTRGNTGSASIYLMLEELARNGAVEPGQRILCMVPESGRFLLSFMLLTAVGSGGRIAARTERGPASEPDATPMLSVGDDALRQSLVRRLARVWIAFESDVRRVPVIARIHEGRVTIDDYRRLLMNLRQQVVDGSRWIARAASSITLQHAEVRSKFFEHASDEHLDYTMLERDYVAVGGDLETIRGGQKNIGSEALSAWMFHRASQPDPFDLLGAMFIIEGLGKRMAWRWGVAIRDALSLGDEAVSFLLYHGKNDENHFERLESVLRSDLLDEALADRIVKTAKVTARLYRLQLEELDNT